jgi:hypothetical protein
MTNQELISTLLAASANTKDNIPLSILLAMAAERIKELSNG